MHNIKKYCIFVIDKNNKQLLIKYKQDEQLQRIITEFTFIFKR